MATVTAILYPGAHFSGSHATKRTPTRRIREVITTLKKACGVNKIESYHVMISGRSLVALAQRAFTPSYLLKNIKAWQKTCVYLRFHLATTCVHFSRDQTCLQGNASISRLATQGKSAQVLLFTSSYMLLPAD